MEYVYGALLLHSAGQKIDEAAMKKVMTASGATADEAKIKALVASLDGVDIEEAISKSAAIAVAAPAAAPAAGAAAPAAEEKESAADHAKAEEEAAEGLGALFG